MRDAIVTSGWVWGALNVPERLALSLAHAGARVLYCENPLSFFREPVRPLAEKEKNVFVYKLAHISHRLNQQHFFSQLQAKILANQIERKARQLKLNRPIFFYPHGETYQTLSREMKQRGFDLVHICMDYHIQIQLEHVQISDVTLSIIEAAYSELREMFDGKIHWLRQFGHVPVSGAAPGEAVPPLPVELLRIPSPRLIYVGNVDGRVDLELVRELLRKHPAWHFIAFGSEDRVGLPNSHFLPWVPATEWSKLLGPGTIGFMPYDISIAKNLHCAPLKLFDYWERGIPVVGTPIVYLRDYPDLAYTGGTADELADAVRQALEEPADSPKKTRRAAVAGEHSVDNMARILSPLLRDTPEFPPPGWQNQRLTQPHRR